MDDLLPLLASYATFMSPAGLALVLSKFTAIPRVKQLLRLTATIIVLVITSLFIFSFSTDTLCDGTGLKGYVRCNIIPTYIANLSIPIYLLSLGALAIWTLGVVIICAALEFGKLRQKDNAK